MSKNVRYKGKVVVLVPTHPTPDHASKLPAESASLTLLHTNHRKRQSQWPCMTLVHDPSFTSLTSFSKHTPFILLRQALPPRPCPDSCSPTISSPQSHHRSCSLRFHHQCLYVALLLRVRKWSDTECPDSFTINAVAQDDFSDVPIPDAPAQPPHSPHTGVEKAVSAATLNKRKEERSGS